MSAPMLPRIGVAARRSPEQRQQRHAEVRVALAQAQAAALPEDLADWPAAWREIYEERAALQEHEGGLARQDAEREAEHATRAACTRAALLGATPTVDPRAGDAVAGTGQETTRTGGP